MSAQPGDASTPDEVDWKPSKDRASRGESAVALKIAGADYSQIAKVLGYASPAAARQAVEAALASAVSMGDRDNERRLAIGRIETLLRSVWPKATDPDHPDQSVFGRLALAYIDRGIKLQGLDAPTEITMHTPTLTEFNQVVAELTSRARQGLPQEKSVIDDDIIDVEALDG